MRAAFKLIAALLLAFFGLLPREALAQNVCIAKGYTVGFFNGVWNDELGAQNGMQSLKAMIGSSFRDEPVQYETFYNHTGSAVGATFMQDIAEVFIQRAREIDSSGTLEQRWELLWEAVFDSDQTTWDRLVSSISNAGSVLSALYTDIVSKSAAGWSLLLSNPPTSVDSATHRGRLDTLTLQGQKLLLVAHSQGNLFVNPAYDFAASKAPRSSLAAYHIAPASSTLRGSHRLADIDLVINALRLEGLSTIPPINLNLPVNLLADASGHQLVATYLDSRRPGRATIKTDMEGALTALTAPPSQASSGFFTVTLTWDGAGDVDLHVFEPNGSHVYYQALTGTSGFLDVDNTVSNGPEHYYASCDATKVQEGVYRIGINNYARATGRTATLQLASAARGELLTTSLGVGPVRGSAGGASPSTVFSVRVRRDPTSGQLVAAPE